MPLNNIMLVGLQRRSEIEWVATMKAYGDEAPSSYAHEHVVESFGRPRIYGRMLQDSDLRPEFSSEHRGSARVVLERITAGRAGRFTIDADGRFDDFHGNHGLRNLADLAWFTAAAMRRGIGWSVDQTYRHNDRVVGRFRVIRIITSAGRGSVEVRKEPIGAA